MVRKLITGLVALVVIAFGVWYVTSKARILEKGTDKLINTALYTCDGGKTITASFYEGPPAPMPKPGEPPTSNDSVVLTFESGSSIMLGRTVSADGGRYVNTDESFVFWDKGNNALVLQNGAEKDYTGCMTGDGGALQTVSTGKGITFSYPDDFGLATMPEQVLAKSYIPPCNEGFNYCLYYDGADYQGTNFESAGIGITARTDLSTSTCLSAPPLGYTRPLVTTTTVNAAYAASVMGPAGDAGAGHYAAGSVYRLLFGNTCYEFETRIGETQFANYPPGAILQFTDAARTTLQQRLRNILDGVALTGNGTQVVFP